MPHSNPPGSLDVTVELDRQSSIPNPGLKIVHERRRPHPYKMVVQLFDAMRRLGKLEDCGYGTTGRLVRVKGATPWGNFELKFHCPQDRYGLEIKMGVDAPTVAERQLIAETCKSRTSLDAFSQLFDLMSIRTESPTFEPSDTPGVLDALDSVFGPRHD